MTRKRLFVQIVPWFLFATLAPLALVIAIMWKVVENDHLSLAREDLRGRAELLRLDLESSPAMDVAEAGALCKQAAGDSEKTRYTVIRTDGVVLGDSMEDAARMENHADRPEVREAKAGQEGWSVRFSDTLRKRLVYVAVPVRRNGETIGVVRASRPVDTIRATQMRILYRILIMGLFAAFVSAGIGLFASRRLIEPLEEMEEGARRFAEGDLNTRVPAPDSLEMANLADALNRMAALLDERIQTETGQRR